MDITPTVIWERMKGVTGRMGAQFEPVLPLFICCFAVFQGINNISLCIKISFKLTFLLIQRHFLNTNFPLKIRYIWHHRKKFNSESVNVE